MRILHIALGLGNGGAEGALFRLATSDKTNNHIVISIMGDGFYGKRLKDVGIQLYSLNVARGKIPFSVFIDIYRIIKDVKPDVVQTWLYHADLLGGMLAKIAGVKGIVWGIRHSNLDPGLNSRLTILMAKVSGILSNFIPNKIVSCSIKATQVHQAIGYRSDKMITIPNGYNLEILKFSDLFFNEFRQKYQLSKNEVVIGMIGRWTVLKDHANLFNALSILKQRGVINFKCILVGSEIDNRNTELVNQISKYGIEELIILTGPTNNIAIPLSAIDLLVLPSSGEAFPNVVAEAMACAVPCVVTDVGDAAYIVGDSGWVVPAKNASALADSLQQAMQFKYNDAEWQTLKLKCRDRIVQNFSISSMVSEFDKVWQSSIVK